MSDYAPFHIGAFTGSNSTEVPLFSPTESITIKSIKLNDTTKITGSTENYGTATVYNKGAAGSGTTSVAERATNSTTANDLLAFIPWSLTNSTTAASLVIDSGELLSFKWVEAGTGQDLVSASVTIEFTRASNTEIPVFRAERRCKIEAVRLVNMAAITGNASNYGTFALTNRGTAGSGTTSVASRATDTATTDDVAAKVPWTVTLSTTPANLYVEADEELTASWTITGTGDDLTQALIEVDYIPTTGLEV
jgi:hypothetical protein